MKNLTLLSTFLSLLFCNVIIAQTNINWQKTIGGNSNDYLTCSTPCFDGGILLGGYSISGISGDKTQASRGVYDYWIVKLDATGNKVWDKRYGGDSDDYLKSIQQTLDGGFILGGESYSGATGDKTSFLRGVFDLWVIKIDDLGTIQWQKTYGGNNLDYFHSIRSTNDGGYLITSSSNSSASFEKSSQGRGQFDYWILKIDSLGIKTWDKSIGTNQVEFAAIGIQLPDSNYLIAGSSKGSFHGDKTSLSRGLDDYWIVKLNSVGSLISQYTFGGDSADILKDIKIMENGSMVILGNSGSTISGEKTQSNIGGTDAWAIKADSSGAVLWDAVAGTSIEDNCTSLVVDSNSNYFLTGYSKLIRGLDDFWVCKIDSTNTNNTSFALGGSGTDQLLSAFIQNGFLVMAGVSNSNISAEKSENCKGNGDYWVIKSGFETYSNSFSGKLYVDYNNNNIIDSVDHPLKYHNVFNDLTASFTFTNFNGEYYLSNSDTGMQVISTPIYNTFFIPSPSSDTAYFTSTFQTDSLNDFYFQPFSIIDDLKIILTPIGPFRAGNYCDFRIDYYNIGSTLLSPQITLLIDPDLTFISSTLNPTSVTSSLATWNPNILLPGESNFFVARYLIPTFKLPGSLIYNYAHIEPSQNDVNPSNNNSTWEVFTTGAIDPNDILVDQDSVDIFDLQNNLYLEYLIRFQNTGNDTAFYVNVLNKLPETLIDSTIEIITSSHDMDVHYNPSIRLLEFTFNNILLPDSNVNKFGSNGFIRYRIKPSNLLQPFDIISNQAAIYFDYNPPVLTNFATTVIYMNSNVGINNNENSTLQIYPNPTTFELNVSGAKLNSTFNLYDVTGRIQWTGRATSESTLPFKINMERFDSGLYLLNYFDGLKYESIRIVKF